MTDLELWRDTLNAPDVIREAWTLAAKIAGTDFVPQAFRGKPESVMAAMLTGREVGLGPMSALQRIHVIQGKPAVDAQGQRALVLAAGHEIWQEETTPNSCTYAGRRAGSENVQRVTWTLKDAERAGLASGTGWKKYPRQMLAARASAELCRIVAPDAIQGLGLTVEELEDTQPAPKPRRATSTTQPEEPAIITVTTGATVNTPAAGWDEQDADETVDAEIVAEPPPDRTVNHNWSKPPTGNDDDDDGDALPLELGDPATQPQIRKLSALMNGKGWDDDQQDAWILEHTASRTDSRKSMTKQEASAAIEGLT